MDQVCQAPDDPDSWVITSEWESLDHFLDWERKEERRELVKPMRELRRGALAQVRGPQGDQPLATV